MNLRQSCGRTGSCFDNAAAESFWALLKEEIGTRVWPDRATARADVFDFIETFYNRRRLRKHKVSATSPQPRPGNGTNTASQHRDQVSKITGKLQAVALVAMELTEWAYSLSESLLSEPLPRRWAHSLGVAKRARSLRPILGGDAELLEAAAVLHDIGYSPAIATTGFHPLDGARFLREQESADDRVVRLVAHHSCALLEAEERGLRGDLESEFELERPELVDALLYSDMTTTPDGTPTTPTDRLDEIVQRYGPDTIVGRFIQRAAPEIHAASNRVEVRLAKVEVGG